LEHAVRVTLAWPFLLTVLATAVLALAAIALVQATWGLLMLLVVAAAAAGVLHGPVEILSRRMPRLLAIVLVVSATTALVGGLTANEAWQLARHAEAVADAVPAQIEQLEEGSPLREFLEDAGVADRVAGFLEDLPARVIFGTAEEAEAARLVVDVLLAVILVVYGILNGPAVVRGLVGTIGDPSRRLLVHVSLRHGLDRAGRYVRRSLAWGLLSGLVVAATALALGLPGPTTLALWAGIWSIVPILGVVVGFAPAVALLVLETPLAAAGVAIVGICWWMLGWLVVRHWVAASSIRLGPLLVTTALAIGLQFGWLVGSFTALFVLAWLAAFLAEVERRTESDDTPLAELTEDPSPGVPAPVAPRDRAVWGALDPASALRAVAVVVVAVVGFGLLGNAQPGPTWIVLGLIVGLALDPTARWVARRTRLPAPGAVALVIGVLVLGTGGLLLVALPSLVDNLRAFDEQVLQVADDLEALPVVGPELQRLGVGEEVRGLIDDVTADLVADPAPISAVLAVAVDVLLGAFWVLLVAIATLVDGRRIAGHARVLVPRQRRDDVDDLVRLAYDTVVRYAAGSALVSGFIGLVVFATAAVLGVPLAPVLGVWALLWTFVPQVGGFLAAVPLVFLALVQSTLTGLIALAAYLVAWQVKNRILQPVIVGRAVNLSPLVAMAAVLVGGTAAGLVGAILATPLVGTARLVGQHVQQRRTTRRERPVGSRSGGGGLR
jgi:putative heme transporter